MGCHAVHRLSQDILSFYQSSREDSVLLYLQGVFGPANAGIVLDFLKAQGKTFFLTPALIARLRGVTIEGQCITISDDVIPPNALILE
jgi:hypothetical protein